MFVVVTLTEGQWYGARLRKFQAKLAELGLSEGTMWRRYGECEASQVSQILAELGISHVRPAWGQVLSPTGRLAFGRIYEDPTCEDAVCVVRTVSRVVRIASRVVRTPFL